MTDEKILTIVKGEEFKICIQEKIRQTDIFYDQYVSAAGMLDTIVANWDSEKSAPWYQLDSENNIIAFCGERGEGKSSAMISFVNAAYRGDVDCRGSIFAGCANVKKRILANQLLSTRLCLTVYIMYWTLCLQRFTGNFRRDMKQITGA